MNCQPNQYSFSDNKLTICYNLWLIFFCQCKTLFLVSILYSFKKCIVEIRVICCVLGPMQNLHLTMMDNLISLFSVLIVCINCLSVFHSFWVTNDDQIQLWGSGQIQVKCCFLFLFYWSEVLLWTMETMNKGRYLGFVWTPIGMATNVGNT